MFRVVLIIVSFLSLSFPSDRTSLYIQECVDTALTNNLELRQAVAAQKVARDRKNQAFSPMLPKVSLSTRYTRAGGGRSIDFPMGSLLNPLYESLDLPQRFENQKVPFMQSREQESKIEITQVLFNAPAYKNHQMLKELSQSAFYEFKAKKDEVIFNVYEKYYQYAQSLQLAKVSELNVNLAAKNFSVVEKLHAVDKTTRADILRAEAALLSGRQTLQSNLNQSALAQNSFNAVLNRDFNEPVFVDSLDEGQLLADTAQWMSTDSLNPDKAVQYALANRNELRSAEYGLKAGREAKKAAQAKFLPAAFASAQYGFLSETYEFSNDSKYWSASLMASWDIFSGQETRAQIAEATHRLQALEMSYASIKQFIFLEVKNEYLAFKSGSGLLAVALKTLRAADENYRMVSKKYEEGLETLVNLLDARTTLCNAQANLVVTYYSARLSAVKLKKAMGMLSN